MSYPIVKKRHNKIILAIIYKIYTIKYKNALKSILVQIHVFFIIFRFIIILLILKNYRYIYIKMNNIS